MAVVEYMEHKTGHVQNPPDFVIDRGYWQSPIDGSLMGWVEDNPRYYVPDTLVRMTKEQVVQRQLAIHAQYPFPKNMSNLEQNPEYMTEQEIREMMEAWYDDIVSRHAGE